MKLVTQPRGSKLCGHCCVAMLGDIPLDRAVQLIGHQHGTRIKELARVLAGLGVRCDERLTRTRHASEFPVSAILRYTYGRPAEKFTHFVVLWNEGMIFDPMLFTPYRLGEYSEVTSNDAIRVSSFAKVEKG